MIQGKPSLICGVGGGGIEGTPSMVVRRARFPPNAQRVCQKFFEVA